MYRKTFQKNFPHFFGAQVTVFRGEKNYFVIISDRDGVNYYFVDKELKCMYPVSSYMRKMGIVQVDASRDTLEFSFEIDLSNLGCATCPEWFIQLVKTK